MDPLTVSKRGKYNSPKSYLGWRNFARESSGLVRGTAANLEFRAVTKITVAPVLLVEFEGIIFQAEVGSEEFPNFLNALFDYGPVAPVSSGTE
jgi:hypothetical protein